LRGEQSPWIDGDAIFSSALIRETPPVKNTARKISPPSSASRPAYRTLHGWALATLIDQGAVTECDHHGHRRDRGDPDAWNRARTAAWNTPFPGSTPEACIQAMEEVLGGIGDSCPEC
jgi:hypothetical protein